MAVTSRCRFPIIQQVPQLPGLSLRVVDREGEPWFVAKDVCEALGYGNVAAALARHVDDADRAPFDMSSITGRERTPGNPRVSTINESGLYALVLGRKLPAALITGEHYASRAGTGHVFTFRGDGWFNMTKAAHAFGKDSRKFFASQETREYLEALALNVPKTAQLVEASRGRNGGTWAHPKLAVFFARCWVPPALAGREVLRLVRYGH
jgi:hypothetical protein